MPQIARKAAPGCKTKKTNQKKIYPPSWNLRCCRVQSRYRRWLSSIPASEALPAGLHHSGAPGARLWRKATSYGQSYGQRYGHFNGDAMGKKVHEHIVSGWWFQPTPLKNDGVSSSVGMMKLWLFHSQLYNYGKVIIHSMVPVTTRFHWILLGRNIDRGDVAPDFSDGKTKIPSTRPPRHRMYMDVALETKGMAKATWKSTGKVNGFSDLQNADPSLSVTFWWARPVSPQCLCPTKLPSMASQKKRLVVVQTMQPAKHQQEMHVFFQPKITEAGRKHSKT